MVMPLDSTIDAAKKGSADLLILALSTMSRCTATTSPAGSRASRVARCDSRWPRSTPRSTASKIASLIRGRWVERAGQRRRRYYRITSKGRTVLASQRDDWDRFIAAVTQVAGLRPA